MAEAPLTERLAELGALAVPRRSAVARWMRARWDELEALRAAGEFPPWAGVAAWMERDGVAGATALAARQTYWRLKTSPQPWRGGVKPGVKPEPLLSPAAKEAAGAAPVRGRKLGRVGQGWKP